MAKLSRKNSVLRCRTLEYDTQTAAFTLDGLPLKLTAFETRILAYMIHHQEWPLRRTELSEHVYAESYPVRDHLVSSRD